MKDTYLQALCRTRPSITYSTFPIICVDSMRKAIRVASGVAAAVFLLSCASEAFGGDSGSALPAKECSPAFWEKASRDIAGITKPTIAQLEELSVALWDRACSPNPTVVQQVYNLLVAVHASNPVGALTATPFEANEDGRVIDVGEALAFGVQVAPNKELGRALLAAAAKRAVVDQYTDPRAQEDIGALDNLGPDGNSASASPVSQYQDLFQLFEAGAGSHSANDIVAKFAKRLGALTPPSDLDLGATAQLMVDPERRLAISWLADLASDSPDIGQRVAKSASPQLVFAVGIVLLDGNTSVGQRHELGVSMLMAAANRGFSLAQYHYATWLEYGSTQDTHITQAIKYYRMAMSGGQRDAVFALARLAENGQIPDKPKDLYRRAAKFEVAPGQATSLAAAFTRAAEGGSPFLQSNDGQKFLEGLARTIPELAISLGDLFECGECSTVVDLGASADWYRTALGTVPDGQDTVGSGLGDGDPPFASEIAYRLARIIVAYPKYAEGPDELGQLVQDYGHNSDPDNPNLGNLESLKVVADAVKQGTTKADLQARLIKGCPDHYDCNDLLHDLAVGAIAPQYASVGYQVMADRDGLDAADVAPPTSNEDDADVPSYDTGYGSEAFADVLAFYGDFEAANDMLRSKQFVSLDALERNDARDGVFRRILSDKTLDPEQTPHLVDLLRTLDYDDDVAAPYFLRELERPSSPFDLTQLHRADDASDEALSRAIANYTTQVARGGPNQGMVDAARWVEAYYTARADTVNALQYELLALNTEIDVNQGRVVREGTIPTALANICDLTHASERIASLGYAEAATVLAKQAVDQLQGVRRLISDLPQDLQECFAKNATDSYRWLADLFLQQGDLGSSQRVMNMKSDFEKFDYVDRSPADVGESLSSLDLTDSERDISSRIAGVRATNYVRTRQIELLTAKGDKRTAIEETSLAQLTADADRDQATLQATLDDIVKSKGTRSATVDEILTKNQALLGDGALVQYVVLPDKLEAILTTSLGRKAMVQTTIDGKPFSEALLNSKIDAFRTAIVDRDDTSAPGAELFNLLLSPLMQEIRTNRAKTLVLQLDKRLRYVPFSALNEGGRFLVEDFSIVHEKGNELVTKFEPTPNLIAGLGMSLATADLPELPEVPHELSLVVDQGDHVGIIPGTVALDQAFTLKNLATNVLFGGKEVKGILHLATHFVLQDDQADSYLQMGEVKLTVKDLLASTAGALTFRKIVLLTLSACNTGYGGSLADGDELASFADAMRDEGPRAVLASLWEVEDASTGYFMRRFYQLVSTGEPRADALAATMREFISGQIAVTTVEPADKLLPSDNSPDQFTIEAFSQPKFWAPFELFERP